MDFTKLEGLAEKRIVVLGDVITDKYKVLRAERISPEAPVLIYRPVREYTVPGGAGNVAENITAMGANRLYVTLCSVYDGLWEMEKLDWSCSYGGVYAKKSRKNTVKTRLITDRQQIARIDDQADEPITDKEAEMLSKALEKTQGL